MKILKTTAALLLAGRLGDFYLQAEETQAASGIVSATNVPTETATAKIRLPKITPNGTMTLLGKKQALFTVADATPAGQTASDASYVLAEGESRAGIKVTAIDPEAGIVTFENHGVIQKISLKAAVLSDAPEPEPPPAESPDLPAVVLPPAPPRNFAGGIVVATMGGHRNIRTGFNRARLFTMPTRGEGEDGVPFLLPQFLPPPAPEPDSVASQPIPTIFPSLIIPRNPLPVIPSPAIPQPVYPNFPTQPGFTGGSAAGTSLPGAGGGGFGRK